MTAYQPSVLFIAPCNQYGDATFALKTAHSTSIIRQHAFVCILSAKFKKSHHALTVSRQHAVKMNQIHIMTCIDERLAIDKPVYKISHLKKILRL